MPYGSTAQRIPDMVMSVCLIVQMLSPEVGQYVRK